MASKNSISHSLRSDDQVLGGGFFMGHFSVCLSLSMLLFLSLKFTSPYFLFICVPELVPLAEQVLLAPVVVFGGDLNVPLSLTCLCLLLRAHYWSASERTITHTSLHQLQDIR